MNRLWHLLFGHPPKYLRHLANFYLTMDGCDILPAFHYTLVGCEECGGTTMRIER